MTHIEDLSRISLSELTEDSSNINNIDCLAVGWLDRNVEFETELPSNDLLNSLWEFCQIAVYQTRGTHLCEFCNPNVDFHEFRNDKYYSFGSAEILCISSDGQYYSAPNLVYHYIKQHNYKPPAAFIDAVLHGPRPDSILYLNTLAENRILYGEIPSSTKIEPRRFLF